MKFEVEIFFLDDSNVTSRVFRIFMDHVCNGCGGHREANVVWMCGARRFGLETR